MYTKHPIHLKAFSIIIIFNFIFRIIKIISILCRVSYSAFSVIKNTFIFASKWQRDERHDSRAQFVGVIFLLNCVSPHRRRQCLCRHSIHPPCTVVHVAPFVSFISSSFFFTVLCCMAQLPLPSPPSPPPPPHHKKNTDKKPRHSFTATCEFLKRHSFGSFFRHCKFRLCRQKREASGEEKNRPKNISVIWRGIWVLVCEADENFTMKFFCSKLFFL